MPKAISYKKAVSSLSAFMDHHGKLNAFDASLVLAYQFDISKERALNDIMSHRAGKKVNLSKGSLLGGI
jgi:hypothetical protein